METKHSNGLKFVIFFFRNQFIRYACYVFDVATYLLTSILDCWQSLRLITDLSMVHIGCTLR